MIILGIETSCDETATAVVKDGREVLSNVVASQIILHRKTGGVVPEVAAREHSVKIVPVINEALKKAKAKLAQIDAIAVTKGPGLQTSLLVGTNAAQTLALVLKKPLIPVNHIEGHMYANWLKADARLRQAQPDRMPDFPIAVLTASGGHNELILWKDHGRYQFLGSTLDDAAGEAFDKVARLLGLSYPGGPAIEQMAKKGRHEKYLLPIPLLKPWNPKNGKPLNFNFSFSGIKTAVLYFLRDFHKNFPGEKITKQTKADLAASFQYSVCEVLSEKLVLAAKKYRVKEIHLAGGVSANDYLLKLVQEKIEALGLRGIPLRYPPLSLCTDNAAMIAIAGYHQFKKHPERYRRWKPVIPSPNLPIKNW